MLARELAYASFAVFVALMGNTTKHFMGDLRRLAV